jgi:hypothetical protein
MSPRCTSLAGRASGASFLVIMALMLIAGSAFAQSDPNPKWDLFVGYQYLNPGGTVPAPFGDPNNPIGFKIPAMAKGSISATTGDARTTRLPVR